MQLDHNKQSFNFYPLLDPFPFYQQVRKLQPVFRLPGREQWFVFRYADVDQALNDPAVFSSVKQEDKHNLLNMDPPQHRQYRSLVNLAFTPRAVNKLTDRVTEIVTSLLDEVAASGSMDIIEHLAYPLPVIVIAELLGIPQKDRHLFKQWSDQVIGGLGIKDERGGIPEMREYFLAVMEERRKQPQDDLISALLAAQVDGAHLNQEELLGFCVLLLVAGNETTTNLIGNTLLCFDNHPELMEQLRADPEAIPTAIEEVLRYYSPIQYTSRVVMHDTVLGGQQLQAGQRVLLGLGAANRDEEQFPDAEQFIATRSPNRHLAFGHGIHFCLGSPLARLEAKIAISLLLERFQDIRRVPAVQLQAIDNPVVYGVKHLPITFHARA